MIQVQLPDGTVKEYPDQATAMDVAAGIGARLAAAVIAAQVNGKVVDAARPIAESAGDAPQPYSLKLLTDKNPEALGVLRHSCAHIMARAVMKLFPGVSLAFGPTLSTGYYYDIGLDRPISEDDFPRIEAEMQKIIGDAEKFERFVLPRDEARKLCMDLKQDLKVEHIDTGLGDQSSVSFYRQGEFVDLCRGPHIPDAGRVKAFKLLSVAGSYWKGDANNRRLQRLYGTAFFSSKEQQAYLDQIEEAKRRDHRVLGKKLNLFSISNDVGQGLCLWLPKGAVVRSTLEEFIKKELMARGYQAVYTPHIGKLSLYVISGHFPYYMHSQFPPFFIEPFAQNIQQLLVKYFEGKIDHGALIQLFKQYCLEEKRDWRTSFPGLDTATTEEEIKVVIESWLKEQDAYLLKPMNCPHHVQIYKSQPRSYRDLPVRLAEFGTVYRHEQSGELNGMLRVRGLTQDDAHLFVAPEQVEEEFRQTLDLVKFVLASVGLDDYRIQLSLRDPASDKYAGEPEMWSKAEATLRKVLQDSKLPFTERQGEAAFYGPKTDFMVRDAIGREWQLGTVQLDFLLPERFQLEYIGNDNKPHRPVMIHRAPFGSMERFCGMLIEHFAGAFPLWLAPEQVRVLPVSEKTEDYARQVEKKFREAGFRASTDLKSSKVQAKIREAQLDLVPYMLVVGPKEAETGQVAVRDRIDGDLGAMSVEAAIARLKKENEDRVVRQVVKSEVPAAAATETGAELYAD